VDTIDCVVRTAALRQRAARVKKDTLLEVTGTLRRRFYRAGGVPRGALQSRYEVEVVRFSKA
jgi:hypothetical protein